MMKKYIIPIKNTQGSRYERSKEDEVTKNTFIGYRGQKDSGYKKKVKVAT